VPFSFDFNFHLADRIVLGPTEYFIFEPVKVFTHKMVICSLLILVVIVAGCYHLRFCSPSWYNTVIFLFHPTKHQRLLIVDPAEFLLLDSNFQSTDGSICIGCDTKFRPSLLYSTV